MCEQLIAITDDSLVSERAGRRSRSSGNGLVCRAARTDRPRLAVIVRPRRTRLLLRSWTPLRAVCCSLRRRRHGWHRREIHRVIFERPERRIDRCRRAASEPASGPAQRSWPPARFGYYDQGRDLVCATRLEPGWGSSRVSRGWMAMLAFLRIDPKGPRCAAGIAGPGRQPDPTEEDAGRDCRFLRPARWKDRRRPRPRRLAILEPDSRRSVGDSVQRAKSTIGSWRSCSTRAGLEDSDSGVEVGPAVPGEVARVVDHDQRCG